MVYVVGFPKIEIRKSEFAAKVVCTPKYKNIVNLDVLYR